jgi:hypothetical protein
MTGERSRRSAAGMPGWVKGFGVAGAALLVVLIVLVASGHGPWEHLGMAGMH